MTNPGYVYALINPSMPGLVKVGRTERDPTVRVSELSGVTGVATPFILIFHQAFEDCVLAERHAHAALERYGQRFSANREFFKTEPTTAIQAILQAPGATKKVFDGELNNDKSIIPQTDLLHEIVLSARAYQYGNSDVPKDAKEAVRLYIKAGKLGSGKAYYELSRMYGYGGPFMSDGWLAKPSKSREAKEQEYIRMSCELNYAPAWAITAYNCRSSNYPQSEAKAWRKFFSIALKEEIQVTIKGDQDSERYLTIAAAEGFLTPRPQLNFGYFPCSVIIGDETIDDAVVFMRRHADEMINFAEELLNKTRTEEPDFLHYLRELKKYPNLDEAKKAASLALDEKVRAHQEVVRWLNEL